MSLPFTWRPGEHVAIVGDTGSGKSTFATRVLAQRQYLIVLRSKPDTVKYRGALIRRAADIAGRLDNRMVLSPRYQDQSREFWGALEQVWQQGGWTVYLDELFYLSRLGLTGQVERLLTQGRSKGISVVSGMQRPVSVTRFAIAEATHVLSFSLEGRDVKTLGEITNRAMEATIPTLARFECAWFYRPERKIWRGRMQDL